MIYLHIGAGAGDKDPSKNYRDGFSEFVKKKKDKNKKIFVVEANPANINKLRECWKKFKNVKIFNFAISANRKNSAKFYYSTNDAPHFQLFSNKKKHVEHYFPKNTIRSKKLGLININIFLKKYFYKKTIDYFSIDIEGLDYEVMMKINLEKYEIKNISLEYLHLNKIQKKNLIKRLLSFGYSYYGFGLDHNKIDWFFKKKTSVWNNIIVKSLPYIHRIYYKRINRILLS
mgnify:CR=1 FL=1